MSDRNALHCIMWDDQRFSIKMEYSIMKLITRTQPVASPVFDKPLSKIPPPASRFPSMCSLHALESISMGQLLSPPSTQEPGSIQMKTLHCCCYTTMGDGVKENSCPLLWPAHQFLLRSTPVPTGALSY